MRTRTIHHPEDAFGPIASARCAPRAAGIDRLKGRISYPFRATVRFAAGFGTAGLLVAYALVGVEKLYGVVVLPIWAFGIMALFGLLGGVLLARKTKKRRPPTFLLTPAERGAVAARRLRAESSLERELDDPLSITNMSGAGPYSSLYDHHD